MLRFYNISYGELLRLPIYSFWEMHKNIDSISAEESLKMITCLCTVMNPKANEIIEKIKDRSGGLVEVEHKDGINRDGIRALRAKMGLGGQ